VSCAVRDTRKLPDADCTSAAPPTVASGELASTLTVTAPLDTDPFTVGSAGAELLGLEGLPLHPGRNAPSAANEAAWHACTKNTRRSTVRPFIGCWSLVASCWLLQRSLAEALGAKAGLQRLCRLRHARSPRNAMRASSETDRECAPSATPKPQADP
jgi:hypothetical protein